MKKKKRPYTIRFIPTEGDPEQIIEELIQEKIDSVLREHGAIVYNGTKRNHATGVIGNEKTKR